MASYAAEHGLGFIEPLGWGTDGLVDATDRRTGIKAHARQTSYQRERDTYLRLQANRIQQIYGLAVPQLIHHDDARLILEMTIVQPPFLLDFGKAHLDEPPEFPEAVLAEWEAEKREQFGDDWPRVQQVLNALEAYGIYLVDVNPDDIRFR